jgi:hypothetical protein
VDENVRTSLALNEAIPFASIEPFDRAGNTLAHFVILLIKIKKDLLMEFT